MNDDLFPTRGEATLRADVLARSARLRRRYRLGVAAPVIALCVLATATILNVSSREAHVRITDGPPGPEASEEGRPQAGGPGRIAVDPSSSSPSPLPSPSVPGLGGVLPGSAPQPLPSTATTTSARGSVASRMAFVRNGELHEQRVDGTGGRRLAPGAAYSPDWSPTGDAVALSEDAGQGRHRVVVLDPASGARRVLVESVDASSSDPAWSPDGRRVAVTRKGAPAIGEEVWVHDSSTGAGSRVAAGARPAWSPDGRLVFDCATGLCTAAADGSGAAGVSGSQDLFDAAWSPDGAWLAATDTSFRLVVMRPDGTDRRVAVDRLQGRAAWFPGSDRLAYSVNGTGIWSVRLDGGGRQQLTTVFSDREPALTD